MLRDNEVIQLQPKAIDTLIALVERRGRVVPKDELMKAVWPDTFVEESNLTLNVSALRKALGDNSGNPAYIETIPRRGYRFNATVTEVTDGQGLGVTAPTPDTPQAREKRPRWLFPVVAGLLLIGALLTIIYWQTGKRLALTRTEIRSPADEAEVKRVIRDSQVLETLTLYTNPDALDDAQLSKYWLPTELGGKEISEVRSAITRLRQKGQRYGAESRLERFDFTYVRIFAPGDYAEAGTIERWYVPLYENGELVQRRNVYLGPYTVDYTLRKVKGAWLIEKTTTPRPHQDK